MSVGFCTGFAENVRQDRAEHGEDPIIAVVVDRLAASLKMERSITSSGRRRRFVGKVDRVVERKIPDRERLKLRIPGALTALVMMIELGKTRRHFAAAGAGRGQRRAGGSFR